MLAALAFQNLPPCIYEKMGGGGGGGGGNQAFVDGIQKLAEIKWLPVNL